MKSLIVPVARGPSGETPIAPKLQVPAYGDWVDRRKAEDVRNAEIAEHDQANRWHEFQRDDEEEDGDLFPRRFD